MLNLRADFAKNQNCEFSIFVTFNYNPLYVNLIKSLKERNWDPNTKEWEISQNSYRELMDIIQKHNIPYNMNDFNKSVEDLKDQVEKTQAIQSQDANVDDSILDSVEFKTEPYKFQREGIAYGLTHDKFLLADSQGLGKSLQCLNIARLKRGGKHCLVIVGYDTLQFNWLREIFLHTNESGYILGSHETKNGKIRKGSINDRMDDLLDIQNIKEFFLITSVSTLRKAIKTPYQDKNGKTRYNKDYIVANIIEDLCKKGEIGRIIFDECQTVKNYAVDQTQAFLKLKSCPYKIAATGTPIMNRHIDLFPIMSWLGYEKSNYYAFRDRYCIMGGFKNKEIKGDKNGKELNQRLSQFMIRRQKEDVVDLPEKIFIDEYLQMEGKQANLYEQTNRLVKQKLKSIKNNKPELLAALLTLRKITCHPSWIDPKYTDSVKFDRVYQIMDEANQNGKKVIIFSNWSTPINKLYSGLKMYNPAMITGDVQDRMEQVDKFQNDPTCKVILGTIGAMGTGLTLTAASVIIFIDEPWNRALKDQAVDRAHRIGTKNNVIIYTLICENTIDTTVHKIVLRKGFISDVVVDGKDFTTDDLVKMLNYHREKENKNDL